MNKETARGEAKKTKMAWSLQAANQGSDDPAFFFNMVCKDRTPKLIVKNDNPANSSDLLISSKVKDGFKNKSRTVWRILNKHD